MKKWLVKNLADWADNLARDIKSLRALWNMLYLLLYMFLCIWGALYYATESLNTAIVTTGGIVSTIFAAYVWSTTKEKEINFRTPSPVPVQVAKEEEGASD